jgi:hypothetical protein
MTLIANKSKLAYEEINVDCPAGSKTSDAYDAALYEEMSKPGRGVLVITVICSFKFKDGEDAAGAALTWGGSDKTDFMDKFRTIVPAAWGEQFRITTSSTTPSITDVGVIFDVKTAENMSTFSHSHWNIAVTKVPPGWAQSLTSGWGGGFAFNGSADLNSSNFTPFNKGGPNTQRPALHEFGHMLGHRDEYPAAKDNMLWPGDQDAVMHFGEKIRERHYAMFADWLTTQYKTVAELSKTTIDWKVSGTTDLFNAKL